MSNDTNGFSLIELLLTTLVLVLILVVGFSTFESGIFSGNASSTMTEVQQNVRACLNLIIKDFQVSGADITIGGIRSPVVSSERSPLPDRPSKRPWTYDQRHGDRSRHDRL